MRDTMRTRSNERFVPRRNLAKRADSAPHTRIGRLNVGHDIY